MASTQIKGVNMNTASSQQPPRLRPVMRELPGDMDTPLSVYLKLRGLGASFLLESVEGGEHLARYSMIGTHPRAILRSWRDRVVLEEEGRWREFQAKVKRAMATVSTAIKIIRLRFRPNLILHLRRFSLGS